ncbi:MAG: ProQ/FINO family protein [Pusillimonas sp.]
MGFEQLAALKRELVAQAEQEKRKARKTPATARKPARETPVDPVVITISRLQKLFPLAFPKKPASKVPLKLGIHKELYAQADTLKLTNAEIKEAVKTWCQGSRYWACMVEGATRLDLAGAPAGEVTAAEALYAKQLAERRRSNAIRSRKKATNKPDAAGQEASSAPPASGQPASGAPALESPVPESPALDAPASESSIPESLASEPPPQDAPQTSGTPDQPETTP